MSDSFHHISGLLKTADRPVGVDAKRLAEQVVLRRGRKRRLRNRMIVLPLLVATAALVLSFITLREHEDSRIPMLVDNNITSGHLRELSNIESPLPTSLNQQVDTVEWLKQELMLARSKQRLARAASRLADLKDTSSRISRSHIREQLSREFGSSNFSAEF